jgi:hypothetical protein
MQCMDLWHTQPYLTVHCESRNKKGADTRIDALFIRSPIVCDYLQ